ncbi:MAG: hypothetical protein WA432_04255 [Candidatus Babeliaceae bacterium]
MNIVFFEKKLFLFTICIIYSGIQAMNQQLHELDSAEENKEILPEEIKYSLSRLKIKDLETEKKSIPLYKSKNVFDYPRQNKLSITPDSLNVALKKNKQVSLFNFITKRESLLSNSTTGFPLEFNENGSQLVIGNVDGSITFFNMFDRFKLQETIKAHDTPLHAISLSKDGSYMVSADETVTKLWDIKNRLCLKTFPSSRYNYCAQMSPNGSFLIFEQNVGCASLAWKDMRILQVTDEYKYTPGKLIYTAAISPDSKKIAIGGSSGCVKVWDKENAKHCTKILSIVATLGSNERVTSVAFDKTGNRIIVAANNGNIKIWDPNKDQILQTLSDDRIEGVAICALTPDNMRLVVSWKDNLGVWEK